MKFVDHQELRHALKCHVVANGLIIKFEKSESKKIVVKCFYSEICSWRLYGTTLTTEKSFQIKTITGEHTCIKEYDARLLFNNELSKSN